MHHFLCGSNLRNICQLLADYKVGGPRYWPRLMEVLFANTVRVPFSFGQKLIFSRQIQNTSIVPSPLFILGHWRSGTTYLQELLCETGKFKSLSYLEALLPWDFLGEQRVWKAIVNYTLPIQRPMDQVKLSAEAPAESSLALANLSQLSWYHAFVFPSHLDTIFRKSVLLEGFGEQERRAWCNSFLYLLRKINSQKPGRHLLLKDPVHTAQIPLILNLFPQAKFVYISRNSSHVIASMQRMFHVLAESWALQDYDHSHVDQLIPWMHEQLLLRYQQDRSLIKQGNLTEVTFEELVSQPQDTVLRVLRQLGT